MRAPLGIASMAFIRLTVDFLPWSGIGTSPLHAVLRGVRLCLDAPDRVLAGVFFLAGDRGGVRLVNLGTNKGQDAVVELIKCAAMADAHHGRSPRRLAQQRIEC